MATCREFQREGFYEASLLHRGANLRNHGAQLWRSRGLAAVQVHNLSSSLYEQRQAELKHLSEVALSIAREEQESAARGNLSDDSARQRAAARIGALRYGNGDYFWINDLKPAMVMHPLKPELDGKDLSDIKDPTGKRLFVEFADTVRLRKEGVVAYQWPKPGKDPPQPKLSFVTGYAPWGWVIGTGVYVDDLQSQVKESARNVIFAALAILLLLKISEVPFELAGIINRKDQEATLIRLTLPEDAKRALSALLSSADQIRAA
jgi:signal transduction histidine kinase